LPQGHSASKQYVLAQLQEALLADKGRGTNVTDDLPRRPAPPAVPQDSLPILNAPCVNLPAWFCGKMPSCSKD